MTAIVDDSMHVLGVFTDGDLRRALDASADLRTTRMDQVMDAQSQIGASLHVGGGGRALDGDS